MSIMKFLHISIVFSRARLISEFRRSQQGISTLGQAPRKRVQRVRPVGLIRVDQAESEFGEDFLRIRSDRGRDAWIEGM